MTDLLKADRRGITVDRQVVETRSALTLSLPKGRRRRVTMFPDVTPGGVDLAALVDKRPGEPHNSDDVVFPVPHGGWPRRSNSGRSIWGPAAHQVDWLRHDDRWRWTFHPLRHVFAT